MTDLDVRSLRTHSIPDASAAFRLEYAPCFWLVCLVSGHSGLLVAQTGQDLQVGAAFPSRCTLESGLREK